MLAIKCVLTGLLLMVIGKHLAKITEWKQVPGMVYLAGFIIASGSSMWTIWTI